MQEGEPKAYGKVFVKVVEIRGIVLPLPVVPTKNDLNSEQWHLLRDDAEGYLAAKVHRGAGVQAVSHISIVWLTGH